MIKGRACPEEDLDRLSQPFVTLDPSRTDQSSGLGLALVTAIAHMHGGEFDARNNEPGLEVRISLPKRT